MEINVRSLVLVLVLISSAVVALACGSTENPAPEANLGVSPTSAHTAKLEQCPYLLLISLNCFKVIIMPRLYHRVVTVKGQTVTDYIKKGSTV